MKINLGTISFLLLATATFACHSHAHPGPTPGLSHSQVQTGPPGGGQLQSAPVTVAGLGSGSLWVEGCWYWTNGDWQWISQQWMPAGGHLEYVGPAYSRDDYCVYTPAETPFVAASMPWPPNEDIFNCSPVYVVQHGAYGTRLPRNYRYPRDRVRPGNPHDHRTPNPHDHRTPHPRPHPQPEPPIDPDYDRWPPYNPVVVGPAVRPEKPRTPVRPGVDGRLTPGTRVGPVARPPSRVTHPSSTPPRGPVVSRPPHRPGSPSAKIPPSRIGRTAPDRVARPGGPKTGPIFSGVRPPVRSPGTRVRTPRSQTPPPIPAGARSPKRATGHGRVAQPQRRSAQPQRRSAQPQRRSAQPQRRSAQPQRRSAQPQRGSSAPARRAPAPKAAAPRRSAPKARAAPSPRASSSKTRRR